jgi:hypothetical protein
LSVCQAFEELKEWSGLVQAVGTEGVSDEETDNESQPTTNGIRCKKVLGLRYRSSEYRTFMRTLDAIIRYTEDSPMINYDRRKRQEIAKKRPRKIDATRRYSERNAPIGKPIQLYSEAFLEEAQHHGLAVNPSERFKDLEFPLKLSPDLRSRMEAVLPLDLLVEIGLLTQEEAEVKKKKREEEAEARKKQSQEAAAQKRKSGEDGTRRKKKPRKE